MNRERSHTVLLLAFLILLGAERGSAQAINGTVRDASTRELLPAASIRLVGTDLGTIANADGKFRIALPFGEHRLAFSYVGYKADTVSVTVPGAVFLDVRLEPSPVQMPPVIVSGEDPAVRIMREVIQRKMEWMSSLRSYTFEAFTRQMIRRDTAIASIMESYSTGYWKRGDTLREVIRQKRQTENVPGEQNFAAVGMILNFYDDEIRLANFRFIGPTAEEAFDYYDFRLEETRESEGRKVFLISLNPSSKTTPLFRGTISVVDRRFVLAGVDVEPNEVFTIPLVPDLSIRYQQQFAPIRTRYWLPVDIRMSAEVKIDLLLFSIPPMRFESVSSIYSYDVNADVPDTLFTNRKRRYVDSSASIIDTAFWAERDVLPLTREQEIAFTHIDSTQTLDKVFMPSTPIGDLGEESSFSVMQYIDPRYSRVEGFYLGGTFSEDTLLPHMDVAGKLGYGFADKRMQWGLSGLAWLSGRTFGIGAETYSRIMPIHNEERHFRLENSVDAFLYKNDYFDYYRATGGALFARYAWTRRLRTDLGLGYERHATASQTTNYGLVYPSRTFRPNPAIQEGDVVSVRALVQFHQQDIPIDLIIQDRFMVEAEVADRSFGSDMNFVQLRGRGVYRLDTFIERSPFPAYLAVSLSAGWTNRSSPPQRHFTPETQSSLVAPIGVLRGARVKEFAGKEYVVLSVEHNFRNAPFLWTGIPFLYKQGWEAILFATAARTASPGGPSPLGPSMSGVYTEAGIGLNHLFKILRADVTYRVSSPRGLFFTIAVGQLL